MSQPSVQPNGNQDRGRESQFPTPATEFDPAAVLENLADGICVFDEQWRFIFVNAPAERLLSRSRESLVGVRLWDAYPELTGTRVERDSHQIAAEGGLTSFDVAFRTGWFNFRIFRIPEQKVAIRFRNISTHRRDTETLWLAIETTRLGVWEFDYRTGNLHWDSRTKELFGLAPTSERPGNKIFLEMVHPADRNRILECVAKARADPAHGRYSMEYRVLPKTGGDERWLLGNGRFIFDERGQPIRALGTVLDITDRKRTEQELRELNEQLEARVADRTRALEEAYEQLARERSRVEAVLEQLPFGVIIAFPDATFFQNAASRRLSGRDLSQMRGWDSLRAFGALHEDGTPFEPDEYAMVRAVKSGDTTPARLVRYVTGEGRNAVHEVSAAPVRDQDGQIVLGVAAHLDVTARLRAQEVLQRAQRLEAVGQLTGGVAHDFNNLLAAILGTLQILTHRVKDERSQRLIATAIRAGERGSRLTAQLLAFGRRQHLEIKPVRLDVLIQGMTGLLESTLGGNIKVRDEIAPDLWPAMVDPAQIELIILNLAINARDAMPEGGSLILRARNVTVSDSYLPEDPPPGDFVTVTVSDTGTGMSADVLSHAFEPFFTTKDVGKGSGLGLAQVLGVAKQLGGGAAIQSAPDAGTSVTVFLPRAPEQSAQPPASELTSRNNPLRGMALLLISDDADLRVAACALIEQLGAQATAITADDETLATITAKHFDAALVACSTPALAGNHIAQRIWQRRPRLPLVLLAGPDEPSLPKLCVGPQAILKRPFGTADLLRAISTAMAASKPAEAALAE
ncbi:MAG: PAS domain S-box protein [Acetobacteraceae bacterium]|nr:PAS domain S-box protein [Acetobacteraceae bacterium]